MRMKKIRLLFLTLVALIAGAASSSAKTVYIQPNDNWREDGARFALYMFAEGEENVNAWTDFVAVEREDNIFKATFDEMYSKMIICRMNPDEQENSWNNRWNQTANLDAPWDDNLLYVFNDGWDNPDFSITENYTEPLLRDYYVKGDVPLISSGWNSTDANKMTWNGDRFEFKVNNVLLVAGTEYKYKVWCDYGEEGIWYPEDDNLILTVEETGYYYYTFLFDFNDNIKIEALKDFFRPVSLLADFNLGESFSCNADPFFSIARDWKHIAEAYDDDGDPRYMSYSYSNNEGVNESGTILAYKQFAQEMGGSRGQTVHDMLVSPKVAGYVSLQVKASSSASSTYPSFIEFYAVNENGTEYGDQFMVTYTDADENEVSGLSTTEWVTAYIQVYDATRIGIRGQYVYMDNFTAEEATVMPEKKLRIASATPSATTGTIYWDQQPNGKVLVKYTVTVTNTGETDFAVGDEGYSVSIYNRKTGEVYGTTNVPEALAPNATSDEFDVTAEVEPTIWPNSYTYINMDLKENISGSFVQRAQSHYNEYAPKFVFRAEGSTSTSNLYGDIAFGKITEETSKSYEIYNDGTAPLQVKTITVPEGFTVNNAGNFTVAAKEKQVITITLPVTTPGIFSGNLEIVYVDKTGADVTYTKAMTGTVLDASKNIITFDDGQGNAYYPQGSVRYNVYISSEGTAPDKNYYLQGSTPTPLYITPLMTAEAGESIAFDAEYTNYSSGKVEVMISTDRQNWTTIQTISNIASQYNWTTYTATIPEAGNYYLGFKLTSSKVDNIYGLVYAPAPAHDLLLIGSDVPATATQNKDYTAKVKVGNVGPNAEAAGTYTASLYVDGEEVATANDVDLPVAVISGNYNNGEEYNYTELSFTYKPHTPGTFPAYIEVKAGDVTLTTEEVELVIAEEKVSGDAGTAVSGTTSNTPLQLTYCNSESVSLYTGTMLGLEDGDKISSITWKGYCTSDKVVETNLSIYYEWTTDASQAQPAAELYNTTGMTAIVENQLTNWEAKGSYGNMVDYIVVNFDEPLVYEEGKNLRLVVRSINPVDKTTGNWKSVTFEKADVTGTWCYAYWNDNDRTLAGTHSAQGLPAIHLGLVVEPTVLAGEVKDANNEPVEGATVTLRNEANDVEYSGTTNADGQYEINVIQDQLTYIAVADAEGLVAPVQVVDGFDASVDFELAEPAYGDIWSGDAANAAITAGYFKYLAQGGDRLLVSYTEEGAATKTIKFTKPDEWNAVYVYAWYGNGDEVSEWPGTAIANYSYLNEFNQQVYAYELPSDVVGVIFNNGTGQQTADITDFNVTGYYTDGSYTDGKLNVFPWTDPSTATVELLDVSGKVVAEGTLNDGVAEIGLDGDVIAKLAKGIIVNVKATGATITNVELAEPTFYVLEEDATGVEAQESANVKIARNFKQGWNAIVLPFDLSATEIAETFGEDAEVAYFESAENVNGNVSISFKKGTSINHGTPYLLYLPEAKSGVRFMSKAVNDAIEAVTGDAFDFVGVYEQTTVNTGDMFIKGGKFVTATTNNYVLPFRSYLQLKVAGVRSVSITIGEETITTAIDGLTIESNDNVIYNLGGQKVQNAKKGLYIINGKKVVVK